MTSAEGPRRAEAESAQGGVWADIVGQGRAVQTLVNAASGASSLAHAWLITGPPGSGRSNIAYAFAAALLCPRGGCGECPSCLQAAARTHPDLTSLTSEAVTISVAETRELVAKAAYAPTLSSHRVVVVEDADRMPERTSNVLLKALEEPPPTTVWVLCAPSETDLLPTIRSRTRHVHLQVPSVDEVATLLERRDGIDAATARRAAREAQRHIGMARRLATSESARRRRAETIAVALGATSVPEAVIGAARLKAIADEDAKELTADRDERELAALRTTLGLEDGQPFPRNLTGYANDLRDDQKRRARRSLNDGVDRILIDLMSLWRDLLMLGLGQSDDLINEAVVGELRVAVVHTNIAGCLSSLDAIQLARERINRYNMPPLLALEALMVEHAAALTAARQPTRA